MKQPSVIAVSDFYQLAALDLFRISPLRTEYSGRYWAFFSRADAEPVLAGFDNGSLEASLRDFAAAVNRTKDRIFEGERALAKSGVSHAANR